MKAYVDIIYIMCYTKDTTKRRGKEMSNNVNTELLERAADMIDYWAGTLHERILTRDIDSNDLEALAYHVAQSEAEMRLQEDYNVN